MNTTITRQTNKDSDRFEVKGARLMIITASPSINQSKVPMVKGESFNTLERAVVFLQSKAPANGLFQLRASIWVMEGARIIDEISITLDNLDFQGPTKVYAGVITPFGPSAGNQGQVNPSGVGRPFSIEAVNDQHAAFILHSEATKGSDKRLLMTSNMRHCR